MCEISHSDFTNTFQMESRQRGGSAATEEGEGGDLPLHQQLGARVFSTLIAVLSHWDTSPDSWASLAEEPVAGDSLHMRLSLS